MAALRKEAPTKSFFSNPSHTFKKLVNAFPKSQKQIHHSPQHQIQCQKKPFVVEHDCDYNETEDDEDSVAELFENDGNGGEAVRIPLSSAAEEDGMNVDDFVVDDDTEYSGSSDGEYPRPRIREDLLPHDFSAWQKSPSIAPYPHSEASSTSRETENFSEVLSSSTSQDRHPRYPQINGHIEYHRNPSHIGHPKKYNHIKLPGNPSPDCNAAMASSPVMDLHLRKARQNLPDLKLDNVSWGLSGGCRYGGSEGLKSLPGDFRNGRNGTFEEGRCNSVDGSCWQRRKGSEAALNGGSNSEMIRDLAGAGNGDGVYENPVEMFPVMETYREHPEDVHQRNFQHHASMVYTRAPSREAMARKVAESINSRRVSRNVRRVKKKGEAMWEEQENLPRRGKANDLSLSPRRVSYENAVDIAKLQGQVEELQRKLSAREGILQSYYCVEQPKDDSSQVMALARKVEELQIKMAEKDQMLDLATEKLSQKETEIQGIQRLLQNAEESCISLRTRNTNNEEEVKVLRCEVAALRWQMEVDGEMARSQTNPALEENCTTGQGTCTERQEPNMFEMEVARKMYLAALVVARRVPREECLILAGILRVQLLRLLRLPAFPMA